MSFLRRAGWAGLVVACCATSCVSTHHQSRDWSEYDGPGARFFQAEEVVFPRVADEIEPANRVSAAATHALSRWVMAPMAAGYRWLIPEIVRTRLARAGENLLFPRHLLANLLQGKLREAGVQTARFGVNSTVGLAGLFDPAQHWGLHPYPEDFGQTFAKWGWTDSTYLFLPVLGPSSIRDGLGWIPDALTDPLTYFFPAAWFRGFNQLSNHIDDDLRRVEESYDAYEPARTLATLRRITDVQDFTWTSDDSAPTQTLSAIFLTFEDEHFPGRRSDRTVAVEARGRDFPYSLWLQPEPAPILYVIPGTAGHRLGNSSLAIAEAAYSAGLSVVTVSSPANWEFMRYGSSVPVPGYGPVDARDLHLVLTAIDRQLSARYPGRLLGRKLGGLSLGAFEALLIAADEERARSEGLLTFDWYLAMSPPVNLEHALLQLDAFYNAPLAFEPEERARRIEEIYAKVIYLSNGDLEPGTELPFSRLEAEFLIGMSFRMSLQFMLLQSTALEDTGVLLTPRTRLHMAPAFREASEYSFMEYVYAFLLPYYAREGSEFTLDEAGARALFARCDLRSVSEALRTHPNVRVFSNTNDFLVRAEDFEWLRETLGDRLTLFEDGGHLGNLHRKDIQSVIAGVMRSVDAAPRVRD